ncbi:MAG: serine/threonine protein kinase [Chloroflexi bacterium]|nr:serine/threonine protein kinase [Chloroflexota bacterium]MBI3739484.1 serine/threonine protein kinase [Chloroflexota bacterium]
MFDNIDILTKGTLLEDRYLIQSLLGQGGMSRVYLAYDQRLNVMVAVKENLQTNSSARALFEREVNILANIAHPNLPRVTDHFQDNINRQQYLVMDYVDGPDLQTLIERKGAVPEEQARGWMKEIFDALQYLHTRTPPIIHRDIKPANIKITSEGKAMLVDFGIAKEYQAGQATIVSAPSFTPGYAPPEQYDGMATECSDVYALGATLYAVLTGTTPPESTLRLHSGKSLEPPSRRAPGKISENMERTIMHALELSASQRWSSIGEMRDALDGKFAAPETVLLPELDTRQSNRVIYFAVSALVVLMIGVLFAFNALNPTAAPPNASPVTPQTALAVIFPTATFFSLPTPTPSPTPIVLIITATPLPTATTTPTPTSTPTPSFNSIRLRNTLDFYSIGGGSQRSINAVSCKLGYLNNRAQVTVAEDIVFPPGFTGGPARLVRILLSTPNAGYANGTIRSGSTLYSTIDGSEIGLFAPDTRKCDSTTWPAKFVRTNLQNGLNVDLIIEVFVDEKLWQEQKTQ